MSIRRIFLAAFIAVTLPTASGHGAVTNPAPRTLGTKYYCPWCVGGHFPLTNPYGTVNHAAAPTSACMGTTSSDAPYGKKQWGSYRDIAGTFERPTYTPGQSLVSTVVLDADHNGDAIWEVCSTADGSTESEACFNANPLTAHTDVHSFFAGWIPCDTTNNDDPKCDHWKSGEHYQQNITIPSSLPAGSAVLRWIWRCKFTDEIFVSCIDINVGNGDGSTPSTPTPSSPLPTLPQPAGDPTPAPAPSPTTSPSAGYCNWNSCSNEVQGGNWCNANQAQCGTCGGQWCTGGDPVAPPGPAPNTCTLPISADVPDVDNTGFADHHGKLRVDGVQLVDASGAAVQLMGMSSHGLHWFPDCYTKDSITYLATHWGINVFRAAMYVGEGGYASDPSVKTKVEEVVQWCKELGIYVIIDWHVLTPGDPSAATYSDAQAFWVEMAAKYKDEKHVLYELANEPNNVQWSNVKTYHERMLAAIRPIDPHTVVLAGTTTWSQDIHLAAADPIVAQYASNVMYAFHFYAGTHANLLSRVREFAPQIPLFCTEWGTSEASGNNGPYLDTALDFLELFDDRDGSLGQKISWAQWSYADKDETSAALQPGACEDQSWGSVSCSGAFLAAFIKTNVQHDGSGDLPTTLVPTKTPTKALTLVPTKTPTKTPTKALTLVPTKTPTKTPTKAPTLVPTKTPTASPPSPTPPTSSCANLHGQCGGIGHWGASCCVSGAQCVYSNLWYSQCKPVANDKSCLENWNKCGGRGFADGSNCCAGSTCVILNEWYSQCQPSSRRLRG